MSYNFPTSSNYNAPPSYNAPPGYNGPPAMGPPGMAGPPPGMAGTAPGLAGPPPSQNGPPIALPSGWQPPANMPNINFNAPIIRLGTQPQRGGAIDGPGGRADRGVSGRPGLGMDRNARDVDGGRGREPVQQLIAPTREEIARTIFVGKIPEGVGDADLERILATAGNLRRWIRATNSNNKPQTFGFAEYEDAESLETATEIFKEVLVPTKRIEPSLDEQKDSKELEVEKTKLMVMVDEESVKYAQEWKSRRNEDEATSQFRIDSAKQNLDAVLGGLFNPRPAAQTGYDGDGAVQDSQQHDSNGADVSYIPLSAAEDELSEIPPEMRETVAAEIASFRDRSNKRDMDRLRREEEAENAERRRNGRRTSFPSSAPTGPASAGVNGVPLGPKADRGIQGAPSGPKGSQFPRDYQGGVAFVNGGSFSNGAYIRREDEDDSASDEELERRRKEKLDEIAEQEYQRELDIWTKFEQRNTTSLKRAQDREDKEKEHEQVRRDEQAEWLKNFDDDVEAAKGKLLFYRDIGQYQREREIVRNQEARSDAIDRDEENREKEREREVARGQAQNFLDQHGDEIQASAQIRAEPAKFKMSLGAAAKKVEEVSSTRRSAAEVEDWLDDEQATDEPAQKRTLKPIKFEGPGLANLSSEELEEMTTALAKSIPTTKVELWDYAIAWEHLTDKHTDEIREWTEKKILQTLGMQDDSVVDAIIDHLRSKGKPQDLVDNLADLLDDEAETIVKKLWRLIIYYTECDKRGLK